MITPLMIFIIMAIAMVLFAGIAIYFDLEKPVVIVTLFVIFIGGNIALGIVDYKKRHLATETTAKIYYFSDDDLIYDSNTGIVYIEKSMTPYLSENGNLCHYANGKIEEIIDTFDCAKCN